MRPAISARGLVQAIKFSWIGLEDFADRCWRNPVVVAQQMNGIEFGRWVVVTIVGADHERILSGMAENVRQIIGIFARHPHVILGEYVGPKRPALAPEAI